MKNIILKSLLIKNFKGIKELKLELGKVTNIYAENGKGKTTIFDSFTWLLFDKDSLDRSKFDVQPLDKENNIIHMLDTEVEGIFEIAGALTTFKKVLREKWVKKRGEVDSELKGTETLYYINEVPVKMVEYKKAIADIIDEKLFKLITNPLYFSTSVKWQDRRNVILEIVGDINNDRIINYNNKLSAIAPLLTNTDIETLKKSVAARKKKLNDDIKSIPFRVDELNNTKICEGDFVNLEHNLKIFEKDLEIIEAKLLDNSKVNDDVIAKRDKIYNLKSKLKDIEYNLKERALWPQNEAQINLGKVNANIQNNNHVSEITSKYIQNKKMEIELLDSQIKDLRDIWYAEDQKALAFNDDEFVCPTCKRALEPDDIEAKKEEMLNNFNSNKAKVLAKIQAEGKSKSENKEKAEKALAEFKEELKTLNAEHEELVRKQQELHKFIGTFKAEVNFFDNAEYKEIFDQVTALEKELQTPSNDDYMQQLKADKKEIVAKIDDAKAYLALKGQNERIDDRIKELLEEEKQLAQQIAQLEKQEFLCEEYIKTKVELLEAGINSKFKYVNFKMFNTLVNGAVEEDCEVLIDGVPFSNANTAAKYNAGVDIINSLNEHYKVSAPVFLDQRESVNKLIECESQVINLIVSKANNLVVEVEEK